MVECILVQNLDKNNMWYIKKHPFQIAENLDEYQRIIDRKFMNTDEILKENLNETIADNIFTS